MASYRKFEEMEVWKGSRVIVNRVYDMSDKGIFARDYALKDQMRKAAISVMSNIGEGAERDGDNENIVFLSYSKGSVGELRSQLYIALDRKYIDEKEFKEIYDILMKQGALIKGYMRYLKNSEMKGKRYK